MNIVTNLKILRQISKKFTGTEKDLINLIKKLENALAVYPRGAGLSAIQINIPIKVSIIRTCSLSLDLYNPEILDKGPLCIYNNEGCLSIPNVFKDTLRHKTITIKNGDGKIHKFKGFEAIVIQHEIDHLVGILFIDKLAPITDKGEI